MYAASPINLRGRFNTCVADPVNSNARLKLRLQASANLTHVHDIDIAIEYKTKPCQPRLTFTICARPNISVLQVLDSFLKSAEDCRARGTQRRLSEVVRKSLETTLPSDAHATCSGRTHVGVTRIYPYMRHKMLSEFESREDLIVSLMASCHLPLYSNGAFVTRLLDGRIVFDGGFTNILPVPQVRAVHA